MYKFYTVKVECKEYEFSSVKAIIEAMKGVVDVKESLLYLNPKEIEEMERREDKFLKQF